jgi:hypothetical protein
LLCFHEVAGHTLPMLLSAVAACCRCCCYVTVLCVLRCFDAACSALVLS